jgi:adenylate cyclase
MRAYTRRRLVASVKLGLAAVPFMVAMQLLRGDPLTPGAFLLGFGMGFAVGVAELFWLRPRLRGLGFFAHLAAKSLIIVSLLWLAFVVLNLLDVAIDGLPWSEYFRAITEPRLILVLLQVLAVIAFLLFFVQLDRLLGPGVLLGYVTGRYHHPRREQRVFMFLDLKGSTSIADHMEADKYFGFLHQYFTEMSEPILETDAEIYQYVGDEVVLTWRMKAGLEEAACIRAFFLIEDQMRANRELFLSRYGVVPEFKAGVHAGEVITAQIGELKSEIVYNGDVLNTAARIQAACGELGKKLLVSAALVDRLGLDATYAVERLGPTRLRGKEEPIELCAVTLVEPN